jgi:hypothetical protein
VEALSWTLLLVFLVVAAVVFFWFVGRAHDPVRRLAHARQLFEREQPSLRQQFFVAAAASGKPRGLRWLECDWSDDIAFALERETRQLVALAGVTIRFEAIAGSDMEGLPAVGNLRNASAVFFFQHERWQTTGKAVFNLNPGEALQRFSEQYQQLTSEPNA